MNSGQQLIGASKTLLEFVALFMRRRSCKSTGVEDGDEQMKIDGSCHCGQIAYEADIDPEQVEICHCTDCQTLSGSAFRIIVPAAADRFLLTGSPKIYIKTAESGNKRLQAFCPTCGSSIYSAAAIEHPEIYNIRLATARQRDLLPPKRQYWRKSALSWIDDVGSLPRVDKE